jgi:hypothetical protein
MWSPELVRIVSHAEKSLVHVTSRNKLRTPERFKSGKTNLGLIPLREV